YKIALRLEPSNWQAAMGLLSVSVEKHGAEEMLELARNATKGDLGSSEALLLLGKAYMLSGLPDRAIGFLNRAVLEDPGNQAAHWFQVLSLCWDGRDQEAIRAGEKYLRRFGEDDEIHFWLGVSYQQAGDFHAAGRHYEEAVEMLGDESGAVAIEALADFRELRGDSGEARRLRERGLRAADLSLSVAPENARLRYVRVLLLAHLGLRKRFEEELRWYATIPPDKSGNCLSFAIGYAILGEMDQAIGFLERSVPLNHATEVGFSYCAIGKLQADPRYRALQARWKRHFDRLRDLY
ncbi:MAG: tetratricopeptide repeat protein, partial [Vicinamibacteria bacterium]